MEAATASVVRYLPPALATGTLTLALVAALRCRLARSFGLLFLVVGLVLNVVQAARLGSSVPGVEVPILGAALGAGVAGLVPWARVRTPPLSAGRRTLAAALACIGVGAALAPVATGYVKRHASTASLYETDTIRWFTTQPSFRDRDRPIWGAPITPGLLAGDRLQHRLRWIGTRERCSRVRARARQGWLLVLVLPQTEVTRSRSGRCFAGQRPDHESLGWRVYGA
jgi:hypothetical protein